MRPTLQREFFFRKLLEPFKEGKQQYTSGDSSNRLPRWDAALSGAQPVHRRMKTPRSV